VNYTLILRANGTAELEDARGRQIWASDADEEFKDEVSAEFLNEEDVVSILDFLVASDLLTDEEADACVIEEESLEGGGEEEGLNDIEDEPL
jgi:hypothetical protein